MPTNLYGPNDNFHSLNSHVLPSLINKIEEEDNVTFYANTLLRHF